MAKIIKVALLGSFPIGLYQNRVNFWNPRNIVATSWNYNLAYALARIPQLEVHFLITAPLLKTESIVDENLTIHFLGHLPRLDIINRLSFFRYSKHLVKNRLRKIKPDLVHGIGTDHIYAYIAVTSGFPNIITVHGVMQQYVDKMNPPRFALARFLAKYEKCSLRKASHLISINPYVNTFFEREFKGTHYLIENPINPLFFESASLKKIYDIIFVGIYDRRKRLLNLIKAFNIITQKIPHKIKLCVVGGQKDSQYHQEILDYVNSNQLNDWIEFTGQKGQREISEYMSLSRVLVLPSIEETAPMVISESQALGIPAVATDVGGIKYMIEDGVHGFIVEPDNVEQLADRIGFLLDHPAILEKMGETCKKTARQKYYPSRVAQKTHAAYLNVLQTNTSF